MTDAFVTFLNQARNDCIEELQWEVEIEVIESIIDKTREILCQK